MNGIRLRDRLRYAVREDTLNFALRTLIVIAYIVGIILTTRYSERCAELADTPLTAPILYLFLTNIRTAFALAGGAGVLFSFFYSFDKKGTEASLKAIGLCNREGQSPHLLRKRMDRDNPRVTVWTFRNYGIALRTWEDRVLDLETALGVTVVDMRYGNGKQRILLSTVSAVDSLPDKIVWRDSYISPKDFELVLGEGYLGRVTVNLADIPHVLLGGATGSGKSVLLKCLILQSMRKGAEVAIADFKGGVDFPLAWRKECRMCFDETALIRLLDEYAATLQERKRLFSEAGVANLQEYNVINHRELPRYILACDEIAEVLDKTGLTKEQKEQVAQIEARLSLIARQGRAFGIHLILATQRPDANILSGQIKNNINCRVCGRADDVLSQIIFDNTDAAKLIPKHAKGRFLLHDGTIFQSYLLEEGGL